MKIVIDIPENVYKASKLFDVKHEDVIQIPLECIKNGVPLTEQKSKQQFEKLLHDMFDCIWDCEIDHPIYQDTVGELMEEVIQIHNKAEQPERKKGKWIEVHGFCTPGGDPVWACSECGKGIHVYGVEHGSYGRDVSDGQWKACPNCGAKMEGEEHD